MPRETLFEPLTWWRFLLYALALPAALLLVLFLMYALAAWQKHYAWADMDWDQSGHTSLGEFMHSRNVGSRIVTMDGRLCAEYFEQSNGQRLRLSCPNPQ